MKSRSIFSSKYLLLIILFLFFISFASTSQSKNSTEVNLTEKILMNKGEILVKFRHYLDTGTLPSIVSGLGNVKTREFSSLSRLRNQSYVLIHSDTQTVDQLVGFFSIIPEVESISPNYCRYLTAIPNDPHWNKLWGLRKIYADKAWELSVGSPSIVVGVVDSGVDFTHEDLAGNIWKNVREIPGNGVDDDDNGYIDDYYGFDFAQDDLGHNGPNPMDNHPEGHGTHVAGTIAAVGNNNHGISGVSWNTQIMPLKIVRPDGGLYDSDAIEAIEYAINMKTFHNINIVALNASWGGSGYNSILEDAISEAGNIDIIFIAAAGNGGADDIGDDLEKTPFYPASYPNENIISVAASTADDNLADFSNFGLTSVDIAAPGTEIYSTVPFGRAKENLIILGTQNLEALPIEYSGQLPVGGLTAMVIDCNRGLQASDFPLQVKNNIALIERGETKFNEKVTLAQNAGARAVIIYNNQAGIFKGTLCDSSDINCQTFPWIPALSISQEDGQRIKASIPLSVKLTTIWPLYGYMNGTSMAAPHVSGVAALISAYYPKENSRQRIGRLLAGCDPIPAMEGKISTGGRLNAWQSIRIDIAVSLYAVRKTGIGWLVEQDAGWICMTIEREKLSQISGYQFVVEKKELGGSYNVHKTISSTDIINGSFEFYDKYLDKNKRYTYRVQVYNSHNERVESSNQVTI